MENFVEIMEKHAYYLKNTSKSGSMYFSENIRVSGHFNNCDYSSEMQEFVGKYCQQKCLYYLKIKRYGWYGFMVFLNKLLQITTTYLHWKSYKICQITAKIGWYPLIRIRRFNWL